MDEHATAGAMPAAWDAERVGSIPIPCALRGTHSTAVRRHAAGVVAVWFIRALLLTPFVLMAPEVIALVLGRPDAVAHVSTSTADVLGTSALLVFVLMLTVTPLHTLTGWRWHLVLRRDYGIAMFLVAATDLILAAITTGDTFPGGLPNRVAGHSFLVVGLLATLLLVPLVLTANRRAQRLLGGEWKRLHRLTYAVWVLVLLHLLLLFGVGGIFLDAVAVSAPLALLRVSAVRHRWTTARREGTHRPLRWGVAAALGAMFAAGLVPLLLELARKGTAAFAQNPAD